MSTSEFYQECLHEELARRCDQNPLYSTRAFAKSLGIDIASLSRILSGKQVPSFKICERLFAKLELSPSTQSKLLASVAATQKSRGFKRISPAFRQLEALSEQRLNLKTDAWRAIADWQHGAIMELTYTGDIKQDPKWIARALGISELEAKLATKRLLRLKLLQTRDGILRKSHEQVSSDDKHLTSSAHRRLQKQVLKKALQSLENEPIEVRNMSSIAMAVDPKKIPIAKKMIQKFSRELCAYLESGERTQVYQLGVCLYPISKSTGEK